MGWKTIWNLRLHFLKTGISMDRFQNFAANHNSWKPFFFFRCSLQSFTSDIRFEPMLKLCVIVSYLEKKLVAHNARWRSPADGHLSENVFSCIICRLFTRTRPERKKIWRNFRTRYKTNREKRTIISTFLATTKNTTSTSNGGKKKTEKKKRFSSTKFVLAVSLRRAFTAIRSKIFKSVGVKH